MSDSLGTKEHKSKARDWKEDISSGTLEEEGIFGFSFGLAAATATFTVGIAAAVTSAALGVVLDVSCNIGKIFTGSRNSTELSTKDTPRKVKGAPVLLKLATSVPDMILSSISPMLSLNVLRLNDTNTKRSNVSQKYIRYDNTQIPALETCATDSSCYTALSSAINSESILQICSAQTESTSSLSTLSDGSTTCESDSTETNDNDGYHEFVKFLKCGREQTTCDSTSNTTKSIEAGETTSLESSSDTSKATNLNTTTPQHELSAPDQLYPSYYMNVSSLLQDEDDELIHQLALTKCQKNDLFCVLPSSPQRMAAFRVMLDLMVGTALQLVSDSADNKFSSWKPEGDTKKILQRMNNDVDCVQLLENTVLKWTGILKNGKDELRMIKTRGVVNMSPRDLKDLLIDCSRGHLVNKNSLGKTDVCMYPCGLGTTTIVENTMKIPIVGGEIHSTSLTHSRLLDYTNEGSYIIVSKSVQDKLDDTTQIPYYSVSILRPYENGLKSDLVNVAQISQVPVPKFLVNKIAFTSAADFFKNLRDL